ncbi:5731_t:CDS:1, partial [Racocetra fulgida]
TTVSHDSLLLSKASRENAMWKHFYKKPLNTPNHNVYKNCIPEKKYKLTTSILTLRSHLLIEHKLKVSTNKHSQQAAKKIISFDLQT